MKIYARILEGTNLGRTIANYRKVVTIDHTGKPTGVACWNHPEYIAFWTSTAEDMFRNYELDGLQWGAELGPAGQHHRSVEQHPGGLLLSALRGPRKAHNIDTQPPARAISNSMNTCRA